MAQLGLLGSVGPGVLQRPEGMAVHSILLKPMDAMPCDTMGGRVDGWPRGWVDIATNPLWL